MVEIHNSQKVTKFGIKKNAFSQILDKVNVPINAPVHNSAALYLFSIVKKNIRISFIEKIKIISTIH